MRNASACILALFLLGGCAGLIPQKTVHERTCETVETVWDEDAQNILIIEHGCVMERLEEHGFGMSDVVGYLGGIVAVILSIML